MPAPRAVHRPTGLQQALAEERSPYRVEWRGGSYYVVGHGIVPIQVDSKSEGLAEIAELERGR